MPQLIKNRAVVDDPWTLRREVSSPADLAEGVPQIVPLAFWLEHRDALLARGDIGVLARARATILRRWRPTSARCR